MLVSAAVAVAAVTLGLLLGLASNRGARGVGALRTLAFTAALTVALTHLLPEALAELGAPALLLFAATSVAPAYRRLLTGAFAATKPHDDVHPPHEHEHEHEHVHLPHEHAHGHDGESAPPSHRDVHAALNAGYVGLVIHHIGDGLGLAAYSDLPGGPFSHADVLFALGVHTVPLVAVVTIAFRAVSGARSAILRAGGLAAASVAGAVLSGLVPTALVHSLGGWIAAGVAGLLMHVVTHDLGRDLPATHAARGLDAVAAVAGVGMCLVGGDADHVALRAELGHKLSDLLALTAPALVLAWVVALLLARFDGGAARWLSALPGRTRAVDGALSGLTLAGPRFGLLYWVGTALASRLIALRSKAERHADPPSHAAPSSHAHGTPSPSPPLLAGPLYALIRDSAPWIVTGLVLATLLTAALRDQALSGFNAPASLALAAAVALPLELPPACAVLVAVGLWDRGLRADASLAFALIASVPKPNLRAHALALLAGIGVGSINAGSSLFMQLPQAVSTVGIALLALALAVATWERGLRGLFTGVFHSHDTA